ncbi:MAG: penicillin-binding transpeptidase domain-containing protein [Eubacteriales bacterium]|nr:penicillin-binding transpeptidase domain-containing protein [Eubacteriales bacterium]
MPRTKHTFWRICLVGLMALTLTATMAVRLLRLQLAAPAETKTNGGAQKTTLYTRIIPAARGEILDRYGRKLVANRISYQLTFDYLLWSKSRQNDVLMALTELCGSYGLTYEDHLPLTADGTAYQTDRSGEDAMDKRLNQFLQAQKWAETMEPAELFQKLCQRYRIDETLTAETARTIAGIRFDLETGRFSTLEPFVFLKEIPLELAICIGERADDLPGVRAETTYQREYQTIYAAHTLGHLGLINADEYAELADQGYRSNDRVGRDGAEKAFESDLHGRAGYEKLRLTADGHVVDVLEDRPAEAGSNVMLTIDIRLQAAVERALAEQIELMVAEGVEDPEKPQDVAGGAAVVIDIATGDVLAEASYPTYDLSRFNELFNELNADERTPMLNRAVSGIYSPGSIFKMVTSVAGLELGIITPETVIEDTGVYRFYQDYQPSCWLYSASRMTHGDETVVTALRDSCNIFFFDVGRRIGIEQLAEYARAFGFGEYTGIELSGESRGYVASPESKRKLEGRPWVNGDTLAAAIGQSSNLFTPLQMANYIATLANGGTRYETHLLKYVCASDYSSVLSATQSVIAGRVEMSEQTYQTVMEGMSEVTENGTAAGAFKNYRIHVGGKTGSAQVSSGTANSVFAAFAPFDEPEIAVVVVVEHGGSGNRIAPIARSIFDAYFALKETYQR